MRRLALAAVSLLALLFAVVPQAMAAGYFGDAPDPGFPSKAISGGPVHTEPGLVLGLEKTLEDDSRQVDADTGDDGVQLTVGAPCAPTGALNVTLNGAALPADQRAAGHVAYVNLWVDWNRDGDWDDSGGCVDDWTIRNLPVAMESLDGGNAFFPIMFETGEQTKELWYRVTLTLDDPAPDAGGRALAPYKHGETEDYHYLEPLPVRLAPRPKKDKPPDLRFKASCAPSFPTVAHGQKTTITIVVVGPGASSVSAFKLAGPAGVNVKRTGPGRFTFTVSSVSDPPFRLTITSVRVRLVNRKYSKVLTCEARFVHAHPPFGPPHRCPRAAPCGNQPPEKKPPTEKLDKAGWRSTVYLGHQVAVLNLFSSQPLGFGVDGVRVLFDNRLRGAPAPNPWQVASFFDIFLRSIGNTNATCRTAAPAGGAGQLDCTFAERSAGAPLGVQLILQLWDVYTRQPAKPSGPIVGELLYRGQAVGAFAAAYGGPLG